MEKAIAMKEKYHYKNYCLLSTIKNLNKEIEIDKLKFHFPKNKIWIDDVDVDKILISNMVPFGKKRYKYFISLSHCVYCFQK